jgi:hypothetical protein
VSQLYEESIFMSIGHREFQIPRDLFSDPGNSPNYFSLGFALFFSSPDDLFPGLDREGLIRPPSILPPSVPGKSAETFAELLHLLRGYPLHIRDEEHRASLLKDARYFNFKGLEQRLIPHSITFNQARQRDEIVLRVEDILKSGLGFSSEPTPNDGLAGWVTYARPFVGDNAAELVLEIGGEATRLYRHSMRVEFFRDARVRVGRMLDVIAKKMNVSLNMPPQSGAPQPVSSPGETPLSEDLVRVSLEPGTSIVLDGKPWDPEAFNNDDGPDSPMWMSDMPPPRKRKRADSPGGSDVDEWVIRKGQWRLQMQGTPTGKAPVEIVLVAVKIDALSSELARNASRGFLTA